jgi:ribosomal protein S12 methylthiotransferase
VTSSTVRPPRSRKAAALPAGGTLRKLNARPAAVGFVSLGCPKALVDSEQILTRLRAEGYAVSPTYRDADLVIVNTCGFIDAAVEESLQAIGEALAENGKVIVTGCLGAREDAPGSSLVRRFHPSVLAVTGPQQPDAVLDAVHQHLARPHEPFVDLLPPGGIKLTPDHYAYVKISEGCNQSCRFCVIPSMRGKLVSRPVGDVVREAEQLVKRGVRELLVVSQDTGAYGMDVRGQTGFVGGRPVRTRIRDLAVELGRLGAWVRLHYLYPYPHVDELVDLMANGTILPYVDVPLQHAHPRILSLMRRPANTERTIDRIRAWRRACPGLAIRSTFITGFPGESEAEFEYLVEFLREAQLDRVGCFAYSPVEGAAANALPGAIPEQERESRRERLMRVQAEISRQRLRDRIGAVERVLIDHPTTDGGVGRTRFEAPEIDGVVRVEGGAPLAAGSFCEVRISDADQHDLVGACVRP